LQTIINLYNLKPGISIEEFKKWSKEVDQKTAPKQKSVYSFEVIEVKGNENGAKYQIAEVIKVDSNEAWKEDLKTEEMKKVLEQWDKLCDGTSVVTWYGEVF